MTTTDLAALRREYMLGGLRRKDLATDPLRQFQKWFEDTLRVQALEPNAMTLATVDSEGQPSTRTVLLKGLDERGFVFYTNYNSAKAQDLARNPRVSLLFYWRELERQVTIRGQASRVSPEESAAYFKTRPRPGRLGAWASNQSQPIPNREFLEQRLAEAERSYPGEDIPMPPYWGGYIVNPDFIEFWQGGPGRLHDRFCYRRPPHGGWVIDRLSP